MVCSLWKSQFITISILSSPYSSSAMIGMQMSQENIGNIFRSVSSLFKSFDQSLSSMQIYMPEEFFILFIPPPGVNQNYVSVCFHNHRSQCKINEVILIRLINPRPEHFRHNAE